MFGITSILYESFYKRIAFPTGEHVWWSSQSDTFSSLVLLVFLMDSDAYVTRIRNFHCC